MNSALKPSVLPSSGASQTSQTHNKPMHPQGAPSFGQPSGHVTQNPFPNMNAAHNHPNAQQNHFGMGTASHFSMGNIPASNHPVANINQNSAGQQMFGSAAKNLGYPNSFQAHQQNQNTNTIPPISQTLPATSQPTQPQQSPVNVANSTSNAAQAPEVQTEQPQSNGTSENKPETKENHVAPQLPQQQPVLITPEKPKPPPVVQEEKPPPEPQVVKPPEEPAVKETPQPTPVPETTESPMEDNEASSPETESPTVESKESEDTNSPKDVEPEPEKEAPKAVTAKVEEKVPVSEETDTAVEKKKSIGSDDSSSKPVAEEKAKEEAKTESDKVTVEAPEPAKNKPKELSPPKKEVKEAAPAPMKSNTPKTPARKPRLSKTEETKTPKPEPKTPTAVQKSPSTVGKVKRQRMRTQHYQSPLPEIEIITKISSSTPRSKTNDEKLIYFYKNEFLAVRNAEGGFYLCQAVQNIYKSSSKIKIRWLSQDKNDKSGEIYTPDFYDLTDFDCILTSLDLSRVDKGKFRLSPAEKERTDSILKRCLAVEKGEISTPSISEEHPDGLDLSLYKDEEQLKKNKRGTKRKSHSPAKTSHKATPVKKSPEAPKVRKVEVVKTPAKKATPKKPTTTPAKKATPAPPPPPENKKSPATTSRLSRGKRKSDTKSSPVVDQKKAKVLAKIGKKAAVAASTSRSQPSKTKNANVTKTTPAKQATKPAATTPTRPSSSRKIKRTGGK